MLCKLPLLSIVLPYGVLRDAISNPSLDLKEGEEGVILLHRENLTFSCSVIFYSRLSDENLNI